MIPLSQSHWQSQNWQKLLANAITDPSELIEILDLDPNLAAPAIKAAQTFALRVPRGFVARMQKGNPQDPLLRQVLPLDAEHFSALGYTTDPLAERNFNPQPGILHKYKSRALLTVSSGCAVNCRYCFRRHFPYTENNPGTQGWQQALTYLAKNTRINEIILSGGDPLAVPDKVLQELGQRLTAITHLKTLRIHTRLPIVLPERITEEFVAWLVNYPMRKVLIVHCNHPQEIDASVMESLQRLHQAGVTLLNQSVLLKGVNDSANILIALSEALFSVGVLPYYLHMPDKVQGTAHFDVTKETAKQIVWQMLQELPGYLVPRLVEEQAGAPSKIPVAIF